MQKFSQTLPEGYILHGPERDYRVLRSIGQGGFGITYLVESEVLVGNISVQARFALKEHFISDLCGRGTDMARVEFSRPVEERVNDSLRAFIREASRLQQCNLVHQNIIKINEVFQTNNTAYYVMEYIDGDNLAEYVRSRGHLNQSETLDLVAPVVSAMALLHRNRFTHYDIKPHNIVLKKGQGGRLIPILIDFGLSKHYDTNGNMTSTLAMAGFSPGFAPIEQYMGLSSFTPQCDVYALGATMLFCMSGKVPPPASDFTLDMLHGMLAGIADEKMVSVLSDAMTPHKDHRTRDAFELMNNLCACLSEHTKDNVRMKAAAVPSVSTFVPQTPHSVGSQIDDTPEMPGKDIEWYGGNQGPNWYMIVSLTLVFLTFMITLLTYR